MRNADLADVATCFEIIHDGLCRMITHLEKRDVDPAYLKETKAMLLRFELLEERLESWLTPPCYDEEE